MTVFGFLIQSLLVIVAVPATISSVYLLTVTLLSQRLPTPRIKSHRLRFDFIVPAHNEAQVIARTVASLRKVAWPAEGFRILVCADNCTDATAETARAAGATVIERHNPDLRGKGYALDFAFQISREAGFADAVVIIDADAEASENLLQTMAAHLDAGVHAVQVHYGVLNPMVSWRTRLITIAAGAVHIVRSRARERLGVSCGIRGTGWCVTHQVLQAVPYRAFSLTEDLEYGIDLGLNGYRVAYAGEAQCNAEMVSGEQNARSQRERWERGRMDLARSKIWPLLRAAVRKRSSLCLDLALDLLVPPISYVAALIVLLLGIAALASLWFSDMEFWLWLGGACTVGLSLYVLRGWQLSGIGLIGIWDLARAPGFMLWKIKLLMSRRKSSEWKRTEREVP